jgi:hypothetical protein
LFDKAESTYFRRRIEALAARAQLRADQRISTFPDAQGLDRDPGQARRSTAAKPHCISIVRRVFEVHGYPFLTDSCAAYRIEPQKTRFIFDKSFLFVDNSRT